MEENIKRKLVLEYDPMKTSTGLEGIEIELCLSNPPNISFHPQQLLEYQMSIWTVFSADLTKKIIVDSTAEEKNVSF